MPRTNLAEKRLVEIFNQNNPVGTRVRYSPVAGGGSWKEDVTRTPAFLLGEHTACVFLAGVAGCVALTHVEVIRQEGVPCSNA